MMGAALAVPAGILSPHWRVSAGLLAVQFALAVVGLIVAAFTLLGPDHSRPSAPREETVR